MKKPVKVMVLGLVAFILSNIVPTVWAITTKNYSVLFPIFFGILFGMYVLSKIEAKEIKIDCWTKWLPYLIAFVGIIILSCLYLGECTKAEMPTYGRMFITQFLEMIVLVLTIHTVS